MNNTWEKKWREKFDEKWKDVECSAHERTSSAACICDSLDDINADYGYKEIKLFIQNLLEEQRQEIIEELRGMKKQDEPKRNIVHRSHIEVYNRALTDAQKRIKEI